MTEQDHKDINKDSAPTRSLFGRRQGRALRGERLRVMNEVLPQVQITENFLTEQHQTQPSDLFNKKFDKHWFEIGFGHGEHVAALMRKTPDTGYIAAEPFMNGMSAFLKEVENDDLSNVRVLMDDAMMLAKSITAESLDGIYILNPDPWHKKRHHKRRIVNQDNLDIFAKILKPGGTLVMTSDVIDCAEWMCTHANHHPAFTWTAQSKDDVFTPPKDWIKTRYEVKGAKGAKKMVYLFFQKKQN